LITNIAYLLVIILYILYDIKYGSNYTGISNNVSTFGAMMLVPAYIYFYLVWVHIAFYTVFLIRNIFRKRIKFVVLLSVAIVLNVLFVAVIYYQELARLAWREWARI